MESKDSELYIIDACGWLHKVPAGMSQYEYAKTLQDK